MTPEQIAAELRRRPEHVYATALGMIGAIVRPVAITPATTDTGRVAKVADVLAALDIVETDEPGGAR
jgi:hypothetical protein